MNTPHKLKSCSAWFSACLIPALLGLFGIQISLGTNFMHAVQIFQPAVCGSFFAIRLEVYIKNQYQHILNPANCESQWPSPSFWHSWHRDFLSFNLILTLLLWWVWCVVTHDAHGSFNTLKTWTLGLHPWWIYVLLNLVPYLHLAITHVHTNKWYPNYSVANSFLHHEQSS